MTKEQFISDVFLQVYQGVPSDDQTLEVDQVADWTSEFLNAGVANEINTKLARQEMTPTIYIKIAQCEEGEEEDTDCTDGCENRIKFTLPEEVLTLNNDAGIVAVFTDENDPIHRMSVETLSIVRNLRYAKPSADNLVYFRQGQDIYVDGMKPVDIPFDKLNVYYVPKQDVAALSDSDELLVSDLLLVAVKEAVVTRAKAELYGSQQDVDNDGMSAPQTLYHTAIAKNAKEIND